MMIKHVVGRLVRAEAPAAVALAAIALTLAACGTATSGASGSSSSPPVHASSSAPVLPATPPPRSDFRVLSMTFVSDSAGFALGTVPCGSGRCLALLGTPDGGATWHRLTAPAREAGGAYGSCAVGQFCVQQVRFATPLIGYAYDPSPLITTDGGGHWRRLPGTGITSLEAANGTVVRVNTGIEGCAGAPYKVESAPVGTTGWRALSAPTVGHICPPVLYRQGERLVLAGYGNPAGGVRATAEIARSGNGGQTWAAGPDSCGGTDGYASGVAIAPPDVLVLLCQHQAPKPSGGYGPAWIRVSVDGGASFGPDQTVPSPAGASFLSYQVAAASAGRVLVLEAAYHGGSRVLLSRTGGRTWTATLVMPGSGAALLVGYQDPLTARVAQGGTVWTTHDGGRSWITNLFRT